MTANPCSVADCGKPQYCKGYCRSHYYRLRKFGDPLGGGTSPGEPFRFVHEVAMKHTGDACLPWPFGHNGVGYGKINIGNGNSKIASRYVCELAHGVPPTPVHEAAHNCGNGHEGCVAPGHLSWKTPAENQEDRFKHGTDGRGERNSRCKLNEDDVLTILSLKGAKTQRDLAERFGVSRQAIGMIHTGRNWSWLQSHKSQKALQREHSRAMLNALRGSAE
jgi:hypothetical protein